MAYQKCLQMYVLHLRCSGPIASRNTAKILTMYHAARSCSGTDKLKHLNILLLPGHSSIAKLPDYESGIWYNPEEVNNIQHPKNFLLTAPTHLFTSLLLLTIFIHVNITQDQPNIWTLALTIPPTFPGFTCKKILLSLSQLPDTPCTSYITHFSSLLSTSPNDRSLKISKKLLLLSQGKAI